MFVFICFSLPGLNIIISSVFNPSLYFLSEDRSFFFLMLEVFIFFRETNQCHELEELGSPIVYQGIKYVQSSLMF